MSVMLMYFLCKGPFFCRPLTFQDFTGTFERSLGQSFRTWMSISRETCLQFFPRVDLDSIALIDRDITVVLGCFCKFVRSAVR